MGVILFHELFFMSQEEDCKKKKICLANATSSFQQILF